jgi:polysaccharide export outer membrane protein
MKLRPPLLLLAIALGSTAHAGGYRVGPGDVLEIEVTQEPKLTGPVTITDQGTIELELVGRLVVEGKTVEEVDELLTGRLKEYFKKPTVRLKVGEYHSQKVYVLGAISKPGPYVLSGEKSLLDVVLEAGGTTPQSLGRLVLIRSEAGNSMSIELDKLLAGGVAGPSNAPLGNGDVIFVPGADMGLAGSGGVVDPSNGASVTVMGEVTKPGVFRLEPGATALAAVLAAGGTTKYAAPNRAKVIRAKGNARDVFELELGDIMKHGEKSKDIELQPGDMVIVPTRRF